MVSLAGQVSVRGVRFGLRVLGRLLDDDGQLVKMYRRLGYVPNVIVPRSFNEKVMKRKLSPAPANWSVLADKVRVRDYVSRVVGPEILNEVYLVTENPEEIRLDRLPGQFVVKANHGSSWIRIVTDTSRVREDELRMKCRDWLGRRYGRRTRERWYDAIPPRIVVERLLQDEHGLLLNYKIWVFHGVAEFVQVSPWLLSPVTQTIYDTGWRRQEWTINRPKGPDYPRPDGLGELLTIAERLAGDIDFVRVDLYCLGGRVVVFGEMTLAPDGGQRPFLPDRRYDFAVGALW